MPQDQNHLVVLVHGINTRAFWMEEIQPSLESAGFSVSLTSYGKFPVLKFLSIFSRQRELAIQRILGEIRLAREAYIMEHQHEPARISVISHSFGTYIIARILSDYYEFKFYRLVFCGSVVRDDFAFDEHQIVQRFTPPLLNEAGTRDYWPAVAESAGWGYGSAGSTGFVGPLVTTRWHNGFTHSDFLKKEFCDKFWVPFLLGQAPIPADRGQEMPLWIRAITWLPLRWLFVPQLVSLGFIALVLAAAYLVLPANSKAEIREKIQDPSTIWKKPILGTAITNGDATVKGVKIVLTELNMYSGEINDVADAEWREAVRNFERDANIAVDQGWVGMDVIEALEKRPIADLKKKLKTR